MTEFVIHINPWKPSVLKAAIELLSSEDQKAEVSQTEKLIFFLSIQNRLNYRASKIYFGII